MNLRDGVLYVRTLLTELRPHYWSDTEIIMHLNDSAQRMCSAAQSLVEFVKFTTRQIGGDGDYADSWAQEYTLPIAVDQIIGAAYFSGTVFPLLPAPRETVQLGGYVGGIPFYFYEKQNTRTLTPMVAGGRIEQYPIPPTEGPDARTTIGLYPVPQSALDIYIWYQAWHPLMQNPFDPVAIPTRFKKAWCAYALARCKEKQGATDAADRFDLQHEQGIEEFIQWRIQNGQEIMPPIYSNQPIPPMFLRGANTVIVVANNPTFTNM